LREDRELIGKDAQRTVLAEFEEWAGRAREQCDAQQPAPLFQVLPLAGPAPGEQITETAEFVVRLNQGKERLWIETSYAKERNAVVLFHRIHELLWNWCVGQNTDVVGRMLRALEDQFAYYDEHGIPSDFMLRQIGRAPFAAFQNL
jgi:hypothetical protein